MVDFTLSEEKLLCVKKHATSLLIRCFLLLQNMIKPASFPAQ